MLRHILVSWRKQLRWWCALFEANELVAQARGIVGANRYRLAALVLKTITEAITDVHNAGKGDDVELLRKAIRELELVMDEHLGFARKPTRTPPDSESRTSIGETKEEVRLRSAPPPRAWPMCRRRDL